MPLNDSSPSRTALDAALDWRPLTVTAETSVAEVISTLGKAHSSCNLPGLELSLHAPLAMQARAGAVWVVEENRLLGRFTETDALGEIAAGRGDSTRPIGQVMQPAAITYRLSARADAFEALSLLRQNGLLQLPVIDQQGKFVGVITPEGLRSILHLDPLLKEQTAEQVIHRPLLTAVADEPVMDLARRMAHHPTDTLVLTEAEDGAPLAGLLLTRDVIQLQCLGVDLHGISGRSVMHPRPLTVTSGESALAAYWSMQQHQVQRFAVAQPDSLVGTASPVSFLYTLELDKIIQTHQAVQISMQQFATAQATAARAAPSPQEEVDTLKQQLESSRLLGAMALHIRQSLDLYTILQTAVDEVRTFLQSDRVLVYQFNPDMSGTVVVESLGAEWRPALHSTVQDTCFAQNYAEAYQAGRHQVVDDIYTAGLSQCHIDILVLFDVRACLIVPILQEDHLWGLLCAYHCSGPRHWRSYEVDLLNQLATHVAIAIKQSELYQQAQTEIRERQRFEQQLQASLTEKETLLKEIHHRVKNNLQIISSVLRLQSDLIQDDQILSLFTDSQNRIRSMALIHEKLYKSKDLLRVNMEDYIHDLTAGLFPSFSPQMGTIDLQIKAEGVYLNIDTAIPCGLIIHELVSNSLKHAFPPSHQGDNRVRVDLHPGRDALQYVLAVSDNGIGFPQDIDFRSTDSLGLELVCVFTKQLDGTVDLISDEGTSFVVTFTEQGSPGEAS